MLMAMKFIVDGYIRLKDRKMLEALRENWRQMRSRLQEAMGGFEVSPSIQQFNREILVIDRFCERWNVLLRTFRYPENHTDSARQRQLFQRGASVPRRRLGSAQVDTVVTYTSQTGSHAECE